MAATVVVGDAWRGSERIPMSGASDERADKARRSDSPVPKGAGGGLRMTVLTSLERQTSLTSVGRLVLLARRHARDYALFTDRLFAAPASISFLK